MLRIAWFTERYPSSAAQRELQLLRELGVEVHPVSLEEIDHAVADEAERQEVVRTFYLRRTAASRGRASHKLAARRPITYLAAVAKAARLGGTDVKQIQAWLRNFHQALTLVDWLGSRGLTHVHVAGALAPAGIATMARGLGPVTFSMAVDGPELRDETLNRLADKLAAARFVCAPTARVRRDVCRLLPARRWGDVEVVPPGVELHAPSPPPTDGGPVRLLAAAPLEEAHGHSILIDAVAQLRDAGTPVLLTVAGQGSARPALEKQIQARDLGGCITLAGPVNQLTDLCRQSHAFVHTSLECDMPSELLLAMALQLPCIVTGLPDFVSHEKDALVVPPADVPALLAALKRLEGDAQRRKRLGQAARAMVEERFSEAGRAKSLATLFQARG